MFFPLVKPGCLLNFKTKVLFFSGNKIVISAYNFWIYLPIDLLRELKLKQPIKILLILGNLYTLLLVTLLHILLGTEEMQERNSLHWTNSAFEVMCRYYWSNKANVLTYPKVWKDFEICLFQIARIRTCLSQILSLVFLSPFDIGNLILTFYLVII